MLKTVEDTTGNGIVFLIQNPRPENVVSNQVTMNVVECAETSLHGNNELASGSTDLINRLKTIQKFPNEAAQNKVTDSCPAEKEMDELVNCAAEFHILLKSNKAELKLKGSPKVACRSTEDNMDTSGPFSLEDTDNGGQNDVSNKKACIHKDKKLSKEFKESSQNSLTPVVQECRLRERQLCDTVIFIEHQEKEQNQWENQLAIYIKDTEDVSFGMGCTQVSVRNDFENNDFGDEDSLDYRPRTPPDYATKFEEVDKLCNDHNNNANNDRNHSSGFSIELKDAILDFSEMFDCPLRDVKASGGTKQVFSEHGLGAFQCDSSCAECDSSWEINSFDSAIKSDEEISRELTTFDAINSSKNRNDTKLVDCFYTPNCEAPKMYKHHIEFTPKREELPKPCVTDKLEVNLFDDKANESSNSSPKSDQDKAYNCEIENNSSSSFETRKRNIDLSLQWIRNELEEMDLLDLQLVNQFSSMLNDIELMKEDMKAFEEYLLDHKNVDTGQTEKYPLDLDEIDGILGMEHFCDSSVHQEDSAYASDIEAVCSEISTFYALSKVSPPGKLRCFVMETI